MTPVGRRSRTLLIAGLVAMCWLLGLPAPAIGHAAEPEVDSAASGTARSVAEPGGGTEATLRAHRPIPPRIVRAEGTATPGGAGPVTDVVPPPAPAAQLIFLIVAAAAPARPTAATRSATRGRGPPARSGATGDHAFPCRYAPSATPTA